MDGVVANPWSFPMSVPLVVILSAIGALTLALDAASVFFRILPFEVARYLIGAGGVFLIVNLLLARRLKERKIRPASPDASQMRREFFASLRTSAIFAFSAIFTVLGSKAGIMKAYGDPAAFGWAYFAFSLGALIVLHDAWFYWTHRLIHDPRLFRRFHRLHHKSNNPSPWTAYSFDVGEAFVNTAFMPLALLVLPVSQLAIFLFLAHMIIRNAMGHSGYELFPSNRNGRPLFDWMTSVTHHDLHHAQAGWNYGLYFTWWDRMMGTEHPLYHEKFAAAVRAPLDGSAVRAIAERA
ncbi:MAG TPA: sterol desaturase family protein [Amphiplicatus sp.]|nr:sterol desaturase family protein [Amphiplicatus sp.]